MNDAEAVLLSLGGHDEWIADALIKVTGLKRHQSGARVAHTIRVTPGIALAMADWLDALPHHQRGDVP